MNRNQTASSSFLKAAGEDSHRPHPFDAGMIERLSKAITDAILDSLSASGVPLEKSVKADLGIEPSKDTDLAARAAVATGQRKFRASGQQQRNLKPGSAQLLATKSVLPIHFALCSKLCKDANGNDRQGRTSCKVCGGAGFSHPFPSLAAQAHKATQAREPLNVGVTTLDKAIVTTDGPVTGVTPLGILGNSLFEMGTTPGAFGHGWSDDRTQTNVAVGASDTIKPSPVRKSDEEELLALAEKLAKYVENADEVVAKDATGELPHVSLARTMLSKGFSRANIAEALGCEIPDLEKWGL